MGRTRTLFDGARSSPGAGEWEQGGLRPLPEPVSPAHAELFRLIERFGEASYRHGQVDGECPDGTAGTELVDARVLERQLRKALNGWGIL